MSDIRAQFRELEASVLSCIAYQSRWQTLTDAVDALDTARIKVGSYIYDKQKIQAELSLDDTELNVLFKALEAAEQEVLRIVGIGTAMVQRRTQQGASEGE